MTKALFSVATDPDAVTLLRETAEKAQVPIGDLLALFIRKGVASTTIDKLQTWGLTLKPALGRPKTVGLTPREHSFLTALSILRTRNDPWSARAFTLTEVADRMGQPPREAWRLGNMLADRGRVAFVASSGKDRHGRPHESIWWDTSTQAPIIHADLVFEGLQKVRSWLENGTMSYGDRANCLRWLETEIGLSENVRDVFVKRLPDEISSDCLAPESMPNFRSFFRQRFGQYFPIPEVWNTYPRRAADGTMVKYGDSRYPVEVAP